MRQPLHHPTTPRGRGPLVLGSLLGLILSLGLLPAPQTLADGGITFTDISDSAGLTYRRAPDPDRLAARQAILDSLPVPTPQVSQVLRPSSPFKPRGNPGIAIFDYDNDGDLDIFASNGPGRENSLYSNQWVESGALTFVDVATAAGVGASFQEGSGVCSGDIDNDGDTDLFVTGLGVPNILFENNGDGTFGDITTSILAGDGRYATSCTLFDANTDGLLDIFVSNTYDGWEHRIPIFVGGPSYSDFEHNYLFLNQGGNVFADASASSGMETVSNMSGPGLSGAAHSWVAGTVDYDMDGDTDLISVDNQGPGAQSPEQRRGWNRLFQNDGSGNFTDITQSVGLDVDGSWMGIAFADFDCDGNTDFFATNTGDYLGRHNVLFQGAADGTFSPNGPADANPFGWGASTLDYDNDGDSDLVYHGGASLLNVIVADNPGVLYTNEGQCSGNLVYDLDAVQFDHRTRMVQGVAVADLNNDGFDDIVTVSSFDFVPDGGFIPTTIVTGPRGGPADSFAALNVVISTVVNPGFGILFNPDFEINEGTLKVEVNSADNGNRWLQVQTRGSVGDTPRGAANRDGIGAVVTVTPHQGPASRRVVSGGESFASNNSRILGFGLGSERFGTVEVLWPGGARNRLYFARAGERVLFPEIPCSIDSGERFPSYVQCVSRALRDLKRQRVISGRDASRLKLSAILGYLDER